MSMDTREIRPRLGLGYWERLEWEEFQCMNAEYLYTYHQTPSGWYAKSTPKVACTSLKLALLAKRDAVKAEQVRGMLESNSVADFEHGMRLLHAADLLLKAPVAGALQRVALFRDPVARVVSAYSFYRKVPLGVIPRGMSFNRFLVYISRQDPFSTDIHLRPQLMGVHEDTRLLPLTPEGVEEFEKLTGLELPRVNASEDKLRPSAEQVDFIKKLYRVDDAQWQRIHS